MFTRKYNLLLDVHFLTSISFFKECAGHEITAMYKIFLETSACSHFHCNLLSCSKPIRHFYWGIWNTKPQNNDSDECWNWQ